MFGRCDLKMVIYQVRRAGGCNSPWEGQAVRAVSGAYAQFPADEARSAAQRRDPDVVEEDFAAGGGGAGAGPLSCRTPGAVTEVSVAVSSQSVGSVVPSVQIFAVSVQPCTRNRTHCLAVVTERPRTRWPVGSSPRPPTSTAAGSRRR